MLGGGPGGLAAARAAAEDGASVTLAERENRLGGILKQCIHDGFGLVRYKERLTGPEYALREIKRLEGLTLTVMLETFLLSLEQAGDEFQLVLQNPQEGAFTLRCKALVAATGCRERTGRQIFIHGPRPAGVYTAGTAQRLINIDGLMPGKRAVILGSGDIGLIMARRLVLEGAQVAGVYEIKAEPSGLARNVAQCLEDFQIPLHLSTTVTRVHGENRVEGVTVAQVDQNLRPIPGSESFVPCDSLILSVGLIPENDCLDALAPRLDPATGGPLVDERLQTTVPGLFSCGNALHVSDLADYVSESGELAGKAAAAYARDALAKGGAQEVATQGQLLYFVPQMTRGQPGEGVFWFRSRVSLEDAVLTVEEDGETIFRKRYPHLRPPEMERISLNLSGKPLKVKLEGVK